jgi:hypothetical protein
MEDGIEEAHLLAAGGAGGTSTQQYVTVGSSELPADVKAACDYVCDGVDDQIQINAALLQASRPADGFGGEGRIGVALIGPRFYTAQNQSGAGLGAITMYPSTQLVGAGPGTIVTPMWSTNVDRGCIELLNADVAHVRVSMLTIGRHNAVVSNGHGVKFTNDGSALVYNLPSGSDPLIQLDRVYVNQANGSGFILTGATGGARGTLLDHCTAWSCTERGFWIDSSDCHIDECIANGGGNFPRFELAGGNTKIANSKAYYSGNRTGDGTLADGFVVSSSRIELVGCSAQDNGRWGFRFLAGDVTATGLVADSNSRASTVGGGFEIAAAGKYDLHAFDRNQTPASRQNTQIAFSGTRQVHLMARTSLGPGPAAGPHVSGSPAANSFMRVVRDGDTLLTAG